MFIVSGMNPIEYVNGRIFGTDYLREEDSGIRIRTFNNQEEVDCFLQSFASGKRILAGETDADEGAIIVDGCFTGIRYEEKDNILYFNIVDVLKQIVPTIIYVEGSGSLHVFPNEFVTIQIPTDSATYQLKKSLAVSGGKFTFRSWNGDKFEYPATVLNEKDMLMSVQDASVMFGWRMYSNGKVLSIVTDELNVTDKAVAYSFDGDNGYVFRVELGADGNQYVNMYNNRGELITSTPYTDTDSSEPDTTMPESASDEQGANSTTTPQNAPQGGKGGATWDDGYSI